MYSITANEKGRFYPQNIKVKIAPLNAPQFSQIINAALFCAALSAK
jgi:hypothetical protein